MAGLIASTQQPASGSQQIPGRQTERAILFMPRIYARKKMQRIVEESTEHGEDRREELAEVAQRHSQKTGYNANLSAEWATAGTPSGPIVHVHLAMADASHQGRASVSSRRPELASSRSPSNCRLEESRPKPSTQAGVAYPKQAGEEPSEARGANRARAAAIAEKEVREAIDRFCPYLQVAAVRATAPQPRNSSPDPYGFREQQNRRRDF